MKGRSRKIQATFAIRFQRSDFGRRGAGTAGRNEHGAPREVPRAGL